MKPINFKEKNVTYVKNGCKDLPAFKTEDKIISKWKMSILERLKVIFTGCIWLIIQGNAHPPVCLTVSKSFKIDEENDK